MASKPKWAAGMLATPRRKFGNIAGHVAGIENSSSLSHWTQQQFDPGLNWDDVAWIKDLWGGPLIIKGIMTAEDAMLAVAHGADAIVVSNHGGRQLDGAPASCDALPTIKSAVSAETEVWVDGGIRSGQDVLRMLALGATGTMIGRAYIYGLGAMGQNGVRKALEIIQNELDLTMAFCGKTSLANVERDILFSR